MKYRSLLHSFIETDRGWNCALCNIPYTLSNEDTFECMGIEFNQRDYLKAKFQQAKSSMKTHQSDMDDLLKGLNL